MSLRPGIRVACRNLALRSRPALPRQEAISWSLSTRRYADDSAPKTPSSTSSIPPRKQQTTKAEPATEQNAQKALEDIVAESNTEDVIDQLEAALAKLPKINGVVQEEYDALAEEAAADESDITPEEALSSLEKAALPDKSSKALKGGLTPEQEDHLYREGAIPSVVSNGDAQRDLEVIANGGILLDPSEVDQNRDLAPRNSYGPGLKWAPPTLPLGPNSKVRERYHPVLDQVTNLLMRHGKKSVAQRNMAMILNILRTSPAPILSQKNKLLAGHPPASHLPLNPLLYLTLVIDSVSPLVRVIYVKGGAGGGRALEVPGPLSVRQRRRTAFSWILDVINKKRSTGSGRTQLAHRIASEIISVAEGRSSVWEKRLAVHKLATASRANITAAKQKKRMGGARG
ncbi:30S ribosomal protein S7 [Plectosphaerella plurivora]|uniref:Small ribosomal subunit protein uS7m n=1 Tax=Plectosphaerella plurivora TaxID=936078 RepID=A0A9P8VG87_9PEZI|nr:30S ribosomal protein S7 [Plectosphaerella plurivora]